ncbi:pre-rRNA processing and 40S ribosomal subunit assembly [Cladophialophora chaetospira]|uniref:Pre-rRNA processing and 40S ribosomal subunit assembly n=1 Tax=Cladophialophora chaetospira TaxID=386627 RepID=A0AA38XF78_9EURO|nr:pre-rRNA processing and 40S ribosomal subunit assembly [Cladophialophora chaetospira]
MLGKRKREAAVVPRQNVQSDEESLRVETASAADHDVFRKHFESMFDPLPESQRAALSSDEEDQNSQFSEGESDWEGLSESSSEPEFEQKNHAAEVIEHRAEIKESDDILLQRRQYKSFMTSRPPKEAERMAMKLSPQEVDEEDRSEALNLKHDLDLQRLLKESHLLEQAKASSSLGTHRHKAVDMRMQSLGSKGSVFHQEKMPLAHRRGILAKAATREASRRAQAQENGIILEKATAKSRARELRRERGVDVPAVGKFRGGTLRLSKKDVFDIQGPSRSESRGKGRRR